MNPWTVRFFDPVYFPPMKEDPLFMFQVGTGDQFTYEEGSTEATIIDNGFTVTYNDHDEESAL